MDTVPWEHRQNLLLARRCGHCAEPLESGAVLRGGDCPSCGLAIHDRSQLDAEAAVKGLLKSWGRWRWPIYGLVLVSCGVGSVVPLLAPVLFAAAMILVQVFAVRRPMSWLSAGRRVATRITLKLALAALTLLNLVISVVVYPLVGFGQVVVALVSALLAAAYLETALALLANRLRRERVSGALDTWEWALPCLLIGGLVASALGMVGAVAGMLHVLLWMDIPGVSDIAGMLLDTGAE